MLRMRKSFPNVHNSMPSLCNALKKLDILRRFYKLPKGIFRVHNCFAPFDFSSDCAEILQPFIWYQGGMAINSPEGRLASALFEGSTTHSRWKPCRNRFTYHVYMGYLDLEEAQRGALDRWPIFSTKTSWALLSLLPNDHMINEPLHRSLATRVRDVVERETGKRPHGPIRLLTNLRVLGIEFNPVSFYYVFEPNRKQLECIVAEVGNFPWFEQHNYVITPVEPSGDLQRFSPHVKAFHVSPFMGMDMKYDWLASVPADDLRVRIGLTGHEEGTMFKASLDAHRVEWSVWQMLRLQTRYPINTMRVMGGILFEAGKLFHQGLTFFPHPDGSETWLSKSIEACIAAGRGVVTQWSRLKGKIHVAA